MTEHWLKFQSDPVRRSRVIVMKQLEEGGGGGEGEDPK